MRSNQSTVGTPLTKAGNFKEFPRNVVNSVKNAKDIKSNNRFYLIMHSQGFSTRPSKAIKIKANYFKVNLTSKIIKMRVEIAPELPENNLKMFYRIIGRIKAQLKVIFKHFIINGRSIFTPVVLPEPAVFETEYEKQKYKITVTQSNILNVDEDQEAYNFFSRLFKQI